MLELTCSSKTLVGIQLTTEHYIAEERTQDKYGMMKCELVRFLGVCGDLGWRSQYSSWLWAG
jgi:hypothetical protein